MWPLRNLFWTPFWFMQNLWLPQGVCDSIDRISRQFVWGFPSNHWINWNIVSTLCSKGGLSIRTSREANVMLLGKHVWTMLHNPSKIWVQIWLDKYLKRDSIFYHRDYGGCSYTWSSIKMSAMVLQEGLSFHVGKGNIPMWYDRWSLRGIIAPLIDYVHFSDININIQDIFMNNIGNWNLVASPVPDWLKLEVESLFLNDEVKGVTFWKDSTHGVYSATFTYRWLNKAWLFIAPLLGTGS